MKTKKPPEKGGDVGVSVDYQSIREYADCMNLDDLLKRLRKECDAAGGQSAWASKHGVSAAYVSDVLRYGRKPGPAILRGLGLKLVERYEKE